MLEINPVLAGKFDNWPYLQASASTNLDAATAASSNTANATGVTDATASATSIDPRRYTQFDRTSTEVHTDNNMSFGDFLDMINPLQHIPVVSSIYRAVTGDTINPISRVAGDIMYGGVMGVASGIMAAIGSVGNATLEESTGKDGTSTMMASLFGIGKTGDAPDGSDNAKETMLADASDTHANAAAAAALQPPAQSAAASAATQPTPAATASTATASNAADNATLAGLRTAKTFPLNRKQPFGGVMAPPAPIGPNGGPTAPATTPSSVTTNTPLASAQQTLDPQTALALNASLPGMTRVGGTIYTSRFMTGSHLPRTPTTSLTASASQAASAATAANAPVLPTPALSVATATSNATAAAPTDAASTPSQPSMMTPLPTAQISAAQSTVAASGAAPAAQKNPLPQALIDDMMMMKALSSYNSAAANRSLGAGLNTTN